MVVYPLPRSWFRRIGWRNPEDLIISVRDETGVLNGIGHFPRREVSDDAVALLFFVTLTPQAHNFSH